MVNSRRLPMHSGDFCLIPPMVSHLVDVQNYTVLVNLRVRRFIPIERIHLATGKAFEDGEHILYVMANKENPKGVSEMCRIMEDMRNESLKEGIQEEKKMTVLRMLEAGKYVLEEIVNISGLSPDEVKKLKAERTA